MEVTEPKIFSDSVVAQSENKLDKKKSRQKKRKITAEMQKKLEMVKEICLLIKADKRHTCNEQCL